MEFLKNKSVLMLILISLAIFDILSIFVIIIEISHLIVIESFVYILIFIILFNVFWCLMLFLNKQYFFTIVNIDNTGIVTKYNKKKIDFISWEEIDNIDIRFNSYARYLVINKQSERNLIFGITVKRLQKIKSYCNDIRILEMLNKIKISTFRFYKSK